jgi:phytoene desaturase
MNRDDKKSVVVIGAGVGGIATAIRLAQQGYQVKVYEKNAAPGGRCGQLLREGHRFDLGATIFLMPSLYRQVFESIGLSLEESFETKPLPVIYRIYYGNGETLDFTTEKERMDAQLEKIEPGSAQKARLFVSNGYRLFQMAVKELLGRNFYSLFEFVNFKNIGLLFKIKTHIRLLAYVGRFFKHTHLKVAFSFQNIYVGQNPFTAPALFSMLSAAELTEGSLFPVGGMYSIVEKLVSVAKALGVEFIYGKSVVQIKVGKNKAEGIVLEDGSEIQGDIVVANADLPYVYRELLPGKCSSFRLDHLKYSCSALVFHWGLDKTYPQLAHHGVFLSEHFRESLDMIFKNKTLSNEPSFYIHAPVNTDPTAAPADQDSISVIVPVGHLVARKEQDWNALKQLARTSVLERLKKEGLDDFEEHLKFEICYLPKTWNTAYNITKGSVFGSVNHSILQMGYFRPHNKHHRYKNLYFVGGSTHPGNGVPLVLLSSKLTSERILKDAGK